MGRVPKAGAVKTRLTKVWTPEEAAELYEAFLRDVFDLVDRAHALLEFRRIFCCVYFEDSDPARAKSLIPPEWTVIQQSEGDLGARIERARASSEADYVLVLGSDAPHMSPQRIIEAFNGLDNGGQDVVLGPTEDGGYDLIGFKGAKAEVLRDISWSTDQVMTQTRQRAHDAGFTMGELKKSHDIDEPEDLQRVLESTKSLPSSCIHTKQVVQRLGRR